MAPVAALLDSRGALAAIRRGWPDGRGKVLVCRSPAGLLKAVTSRPIDGILIGTLAARRLDVEALRNRFPAMPLFLYGTVRSDEAGLVLGYYERFAAAALLVEGVDDAVVGDVVLRSTLTARRRAQLADLPRLLRLTEPLQVAAFQALEAAAGRPITTTALAARLRVSREHLSRQFGAGGAPNLKRVVDFFQILAARDLLQNPGYPPRVAARLLGFSNPSHLRAVAKRVVGVAGRELARLPNAELVRRFVSIGARSRH